MSQRPRVHVITITNYIMYICCVVLACLRYKLYNNYNNNGFGALPSTDMAGYQALGYRTLDMSITEMRHIIIHMIIMLNTKPVYLTLGLLCT